MADESKSSNPPAYVTSAMFEQASIQMPRAHSRKSKVLFGYAVAITTALIVVVIMGGVYYYRSLDVLETALKKYTSVDNSGTKPVTQDIEIDTASNVVVFRLSGDGITPGTFAVVDYTKSLIAIYDPQAQSCYLIPGIDSRIISPASLNDNLAKNITRPTTVQTLNYQKTSSYPISDKTILPTPVKTACDMLPVYWMEKTVDDPSASNQTAPIRTKRGCYYKQVCDTTCTKVWFIKVCKTSCHSELACSTG